MELSQRNAVCTFCLGTLASNQELLVATESIVIFSRKARSCCLIESLCLSFLSKHQADCCLICGMWWSGSECLLPARWLSERVLFPSSGQKFRKRNGCLCLLSMVLSYFDGSQSVLCRFLSGMCRSQWSLCESL